VDLAAPKTRSGIGGVTLAAQLAGTALGIAIALAVKRKTLPAQV